MHEAQRWLEGRYTDPADRYVCHVFDAVAFAVADIVGGGLLEGGIAAGALGAGEAAGVGAGLLGAGEAAGLSAAITLPEVVATAAAPLAFGTGEALAVGGGALGGALGGGALDFGGGLSDTLALSQGASDLIGGAAGDTLRTGATAAAPGVTSAPGIPPGTLPGATSVGGPVASAPVAPAAAGPLSPTATGVGLDTGGGGGGLLNGANEIGGTLGPGTNLTSGTLEGTGAAAGGPSGSSGGGLFGGLDKALEGATGVNMSDIGKIASIGGTGMNLLKGNQPMPGEKQLNSAALNLNTTASALAKEGQSLEQFLQTGTLPPGVSQGIKSATEAAKASIRSGYAQRGMSGSSSEAQDIQAAEDRAVAAGSQIAMQLLTQGANMVGMGVNAEGMAANIYQSIMQDALTRDAELGKAIGSFAAALVPPNTNSITLRAA